MSCKCGCGQLTPIAKRNRYELKDYIKGLPVPLIAGHHVRLNGVRGVRHWNFKGDEVGYKAFHLRVQTVRGKATVCETCQSTYFVEWANLTGKYENVFDYRSLCRKCHKKYDAQRKKTSLEASTTLGTTEGVDVMA